MRVGPLRHFIFGLGKKSFQRIGLVFLHVFQERPGFLESCREGHCLNARSRGARRETPIAAPIIEITICLLPEPMIDIRITVPGESTELPSADYADRRLSERNGEMNNGGIVRKNEKAFSDKTYQFRKGGLAGEIDRFRPIYFLKLPHCSPIDVSTHENNVESLLIQILRNFGESEGWPAPIECRCIYVKKDVLILFQAEFFQNVFTITIRRYECRRVIAFFDPGNIFVYCPVVRDRIPQSYGRLDVVINGRNYFCETRKYLFVDYLQILFLLDIEWFFPLDVHAFISHNTLRAHVDRDHFPENFRGTEVVTDDHPEPYAAQAMNKSRAIERVGGESSIVHGQ